MTDDTASPPGGRLPDFLVIGATKAGTTSLHAYLRQHREVFMHPRKELRYFTAEHEWRRGPDWYRTQFEDAGRARAVGQASNAYTRHPVYADVPERIAALLPDVRLVYLVREPFARLESHYRWRLSTGYEWRGAEEALRADPSYVAASLYGLQLAEYHRHFASEQILVLRCEALFADPEPHLARLAEHLGVEHDPSLPFRAENVTRRRRVVAAPLRQAARVALLRRSVRGLGRAAARSPLGRLSRSASEADYHLSDDLRAEIARLFAQDRRLLIDLAGHEAAAWPDPAAPTHGMAGVPSGHAVGFAEAPAGWLGAALGLDPRRRGRSSDPRGRRDGTLREGAMATTRTRRGQGGLAFGLRYAGAIAGRRLRGLPVLWRAFPRPAVEADDAPLPAMGSTVTVDGIAMRIDPRMSAFNIRKLASGRHTRHERDLLARALGPEDRVLELGGGIGMVAIECARRIGSDRVTSYEANPELESLIRENYALNGVSPDLRMAMVGRQAGSRIFHLTERFSHSSIHNVGETVRRVSVPVHDLAAVMAELRPSVLVVDIQGAERELLAHADLSGVRLILVEIHPFIVGLSGVLAIARRLRALGFAETDRSGNSHVFERDAGA